MLPQTMGAVSLFSCFPSTFVWSMYTIYLFIFLSPLADMAAADRRSVPLQRKCPRMAFHRPTRLLPETELRSLVPKRCSGSFTAREKGKISRRHECGTEYEETERQFAHEKRTSSVGVFQIAFLPSFAVPLHCRD